mmetsp:Transcript_73341/g.153092  ORF Transcript_73341/g.153092 Transcript_73341/m.153092 type:complete len:274 (-) Transcript_73341:33-854(-)
MLCIQDWFGTLGDASCCATVQPKRPEQNVYTQAIKNRGMQSRQSKPKAFTSEENIAAPICRELPPVEMSEEQTPKMAEPSPEAKRRGLAKSFSKSFSKSFTKGKESEQREGSPQNTRKKRGSMISWGSLRSNPSSAEGSQSEASSPQTSPRNGSRPLSPLSNLFSSSRRRRSFSKSPEPATQDVEEKPKKNRVFAVALYEHRATAHPPFYPDPRMDLTLHKGMRVEVVQHDDDHDEEDHGGWILVKKLGSDKECFAPANYLSYDGVRPICREI